MSRYPKYCQQVPTGKSSRLISEHTFQALLITFSLVVNRTEETIPVMDHRWRTHNN